MYLALADYLRWCRLHQRDDHVPRRRPAATGRLASSSPDSPTTASSNPDDRACPAWDHVARCAWLSRQAAYDAGPYEQAARVFRQHGYTNGARAILIAQRRQARRAISGRWALPRRMLDAAYSVTVSYGYRPVAASCGFSPSCSSLSPAPSCCRAPRRPCAPLSGHSVYATHIRPPRRALRSVEASATHNAASAQDHLPTACGNGQVLCFNPLLYAIDTVIPLVSLDQRSTWHPDAHAPDGTFMQWWLNAATVLGWLLSSIFVLSLASFARSI